VDSGASSAARGLNKDSFEPARAAPGAADKGPAKQSTAPSSVADQLKKDTFEPAKAQQATAAKGDTPPGREPRWYDKNDRFQESPLPPTLDGRAEKAQVQRKEEAAAREKATDGKFLGPRGISSDKLEAGAFRPADGKTINNKPIYFTNGINTTAAEHARAAEALAEKTRRPVFAIHNATDGAVKDVGQSAAEKVFGTESASTKTIANEINSALRAGRPIEVHGHSQGAIEVSNAINAASRELYGQGLNRQQVEQKLGNITAHTYGGAALKYADGPKYRHAIHEKDGVAAHLGLGGYGSQFTHAGRGAEFVRSRAPLDDYHAFKSYLDWSVPQAPKPN